MNECSAVAGTEGYEAAAKHFIESSQKLRFEEVCADFIPYLPLPPATVLDAGSGAGQNAAALEKRGFSVTAIEPVAAFLDAAKNSYGDASVHWQNDSLPHLNTLNARHDQYDFVLIDGVWHHLNEVEREDTITRLSSLVKPGGRCAISLRNGPAGIGTQIFPTDSKRTIEQFEKFRFECVLHLQNQDSLFANKPLVKWSRIVVEKCQ